MSANHLVVELSALVFLALFAQACLRAVRRPGRAAAEVALLFCAPALSGALSVAQIRGAGLAPAATTHLRVALLLAVALMLLRLIDDFVGVPTRLQRATLLASLAAAAAVVLWPDPQPPWLSLAGLLWVVALLAWGAIAYGVAARRANGITRRRLRAVAGGSSLLLGSFLLALPAALAPQLRAAATMLADCLGLAAGVCYWVGFAPPRLLRGAWQEPELRGFLQSVARLPLLGDLAAEELGRGAARALGAPAAALGVWDPSGAALLIRAGGEARAVAPGASPALALALASAGPVYAPPDGGADPLAEALGVPQGGALIVAPVRIGERLRGALVAAAPRAPLFVEDDLALAGLLAGQAAVALESRALIEEAARVRAREESLVLKDAFLRAAAQHLRAPLGALLERAGDMERRAQRQPAAPADPQEVGELVRGSRRLQGLVRDLLDPAREAPPE